MSLTALAAGLVAAVYLVWAIGFDAVFAAVARAGFGGLALLCLYALAVFVVLAAAWFFLLPPAQRRSVTQFYLARLVRDSLAEISPFSPVGGMVAAARLMILDGMSAGYAAASVAADATTEAMAQVAFLAFGVALGVAHFRHLASAGPLTEAMVATLLLAVPGIAALIFLQKKGADFAERIAGPFFPLAKDGTSFRDAIHDLYDSPSRLALSAAFHLLAWIGSGGGTFIAFLLVGGQVSLLDALALEALLCTLRSIAAFVPAAIGVQEAGYALLAPLFGLPAELGLAVSLLKRAREIVIGVPSLLYWQSGGKPQRFPGRCAMSDTVLVTGASGFVGAAVARAALARGFAVKVLMRPTADRRNIEGLEVEPVTGDMRDAESMTAALQGARYLFHVAADYRLWARDPSEIERNNLQGARAVMKAALKAGVERVVYTSSVAALKPGSGEAVDETSRHTPQSVIGAYKRSKLVAEREVERMIDQEKLPAVIVAPSTPIGPRDIKPTPTGRIIVEAATGKVPAFVDTGLNLVHVDDVAEGHLLALEKGRIGENYILGGEDVSLEVMLADICGMAGRRAPTIKLPRAPLFPLAWGAEAVARITGKEPFLTADALRMSRYRMFFSSAKAKAELGYKARPYREGLKDALAWFGAHGYLTEKTA